MFILALIIKSIFTNNTQKRNYFFSSKLLFIFLLLINNHQIISAHLNEKNETILVYALSGICNVSSCGGNSLCSVDHGLCNLGICECKPGYTTPKEDKIYRCCYEQKSSVTAFFLEAIFLFGAGHFYVGNKTIGITKAIIYFILLVTFFIISFRVCFRKDKFQPGGNFYMRIIRSACLLICGCTFIIWQMVDAVMFCYGGHTDSNGVDLY